MMQQHDSQATANSLQSFLVQIERETTAALVSDQRFLQEQSDDKGQRRIPHISFLHGGRKMAIPLSYVLDVGHLSTTTPLPHLPPWILGVVQLQGDILPVIDISSLFEVKEVGTKEIPAMAYLLYSWQDIKICLIVDKITEVINIDPEENTVFPLNATEKEYFNKLAPLLHGSIPTEAERVFLLNTVGIMQNDAIQNWQKRQL